MEWRVCRQGGSVYPTSTTGPCSPAQPPDRPPADASSNGRNSRPTQAAPEPHQGVGVPAGGAPFLRSPRTCCYRPGSSDAPSSPHLEPPRAVRRSSVRGLSLDHTAADERARENEASASSAKASSHTTALRCRVCWHWSTPFAPRAHLALTSIHRNERYAGLGLGVRLHARRNAATLERASGLTQLG